MINPPYLEETVGIRFRNHKVHSKYDIARGQINLTQFLNLGSNIEKLVKLYTFISFKYFGSPNTLIRNPLLLISLRTSLQREFNYHHNNQSINN